MGVYDNVIADGEKIQMFIPQRAPMVMVEKLHKAEGGQTISSLDISENNIFSISALSTSLTFLNIVNIRI